jgi:outer membrane lipoprotein-sorting protein
MKKMNFAVAAFCLATLFALTTVGCAQTGTDAMSGSNMDGGMKSMSGDSMDKDMDDGMKSMSDDSMDKDMDDGMKSMSDHSMKNEMK